MRPRRTRCDGVRTARTASRSLWRNPKGHSMKVVVIGGSGLIGSKGVTRLREHGHEAGGGAPAPGGGTITREGLGQAPQRGRGGNAPCQSPPLRRGGAPTF